MIAAGLTREPRRISIDGNQKYASWTHIFSRLGCWWKSWGYRARNRKAQDEIEAVRCELTELNGSTEEAFLAVGSHLQELQTSAQAVARSASSIAQILSNDVGARTLTSLDGVLEYVRARSASGAHVDEIHKLHSSAKAIQVAVVHFDDVVKSFDILSIMTRIESARLGSVSANFDVLADDVSNLSRRIREQMSATAESARALLENASAAALQIQKVALDQHRNLEPLSQRVRAGLQMIRDHRTRSAESAGRLATRLEAVSREMGDVVSALQFQDIIRQQIEHVLEALAPSGLALGAGRRDRDSNTKIQAAQLDNARETFLRSVASVRGALTAIDRNVAEMFEESSQLLGLSATGMGSFFASVEEDFGAIETILDRNASGDRRLAEIDIVVRTMLEEMSTSVSDVQVIGIQMLRVSLNAMVQAARLGSQGSTLQTIAQAIQPLAQGSDETCRQIQEHFATIRGTGAALTLAAEGQLGSKPESADFGKSLMDLRAMHEETKQSYQQAGPLVEHLAKQIQETIQIFGTQEQVADVLSHAAGALRKIAEATGSNPVDTEPLSSTYTMSSERTVHAAVLLGDVPAPTQDGGKDIVENVEFF